MTRICLIRHGEPSAGWGDASDPGLSTEGHAQAESAAQKLARFGRLDLLSSPMQRCRETAAPYERRMGASARIEPRVSEVAAPGEITDRRGWLRENFPWTEGAPPRTWASLDPALLRWRDDVLAIILALNQDTAVFTHFIAINAIVTTAQESAHTIGCRPGFASVTELSSDGGRLRVVALGAQMQTGEVR